MAGRLGDPVPAEHLPARRRLSAYNVGVARVVLDPHRWLELRRFRGLYESGAMRLRETAKETGLNPRHTVAKYLSAETPVAPPRRAPNGQPYRRVVDQDLATFFDCHRQEFAHFGGVPMSIVYYRTQTVVRP
ncbi:hypothetical protein [Streptomyces lavendulae]|uniref:hypothetical protein n=1 Tax=Streptomyces lavendulae TaxID=1914 RepID=UPI003F4D1FA2